MSVTGRGQASEYRDFELQHMRPAYQVDASDLSGTTSGAVLDNPVEPAANGLTRGQEAELVYMDIFHMAGFGPTATAEGIFESKPRMGLSATGPLLSERAEVTGIDPDGIINLRMQTSDDPDLLWRDWLIAEQSHSDSTTGVGGGADLGRTRTTINFRDAFGQGPIVDARDDVFWAWVFNADNVSDSLIQTTIWASLWWDIYEV